MNRAITRNHPIAGVLFLVNAKLLAPVDHQLVQLLKRLLIQ